VGQGLYFFCGCVGRFCGKPACIRKFYQIVYRDAVALSVDGCGVLARHAGAVGKVIGRRQVPARFLRVVEIREVLGVVVAVVGKNIETGEAKELFCVCEAIGEPEGELHERTVIEGGQAVGCFEQGTR
jgi:hypothetical protein